MKSTLITIAIITFFSSATIACDVCGSATGNSYMGLMPSFNRIFAGVRYQYNTLRHHLGPDGRANYLTTTEEYHVTEIWGAVNIDSRLKLVAFIPFNYIERSNGQQRTSLSGLGDVSLIGYYRVKGTAKGKWQHSLWVGAGTKLSTGRYDPEDKSVQQGVQNSFQLGTGNIDFSVYMMYDFQFKQAGISLNTGYRLNTYNEYDYKYGNRFMMNALIFQRFNLKEDLIITPNIGVLFETLAKDRKTRDITVWETGGHALQGTIGLEISKGKISGGVNFQKPVNQSLGEGKLKTGEKWMAYLGLSI